MSRPAPPTSRIELLQGSLDLIVLQSLRWGPRHGYALAQLIRAVSRDALRVDAGSLYPALHRLERQGAIDAESSVTERNQRVRIYRLTTKGRKRLVEERSRWRQLADTIAALSVRPAPSKP